MKDEMGCEIKGYMHTMTMHQARMHFRLRTKMFKCKMNYMSDPGFKAELWCCDACKNVDTQAHILWCPEYKQLREGKSLKSDTDIVEYFLKVYAIRAKMDAERVQ